MMIILHIDDDEDDREMLSSALHQVSPSVQIKTAVNGMAALHYLQMSKTIGELPCLVVLDLNMPVMDGKTTFDALRHDAALASIPVVIFTSGENPHDKLYFENRGSDYITKPMESSALLPIAKKLTTYCQ